MASGQRPGRRSLNDRGERDDVLTFGPFRLSRKERWLERDGRPVRLGSRALEVLGVLAERAGEVVSKEDLLARVWPDTVVEESGLRVHIAALRKALGDGQGGARYVTNVPGRGYCFVSPLKRAERPAAEPEPSCDDRGVTLPAPLDRILGRERAISDVSWLVSAHRLVSIVGAGGVGKTTVAVAVGHALVDAFHHHVRFVDLGSLVDGDHVATTVASAVGLRLSTAAASASLVAFLRERRVLLVLDNCEHVISAAAALVEELIAQTRAVHILVTSREPLRAGGEHVFRLSGLEAPASDVVTAAAALAFPAVQLFVERAAAAGVGLTLTDGDAPVVAEICRRLDGIALAIEFAAGRVEAYGVRGTASLLENRFKLLWHGRRTAVPRHRTLSSMLDWSYSLLTDVERKILRRLSVFAGLFPLDAVSAVAGAEASDDPETALDALASLVEKSLVSAESSGKTVRYRLLQTTRAYALGKLSEAGERDDTLRRLVEYFGKALEADDDMP
jgi:predicted ATPase/DNA-binding winged helix-turn-helix (wHTH) protein